MRWQRVFHKCAEQQRADGWPPPKLQVSKCTAEGGVHLKTFGHDKLIPESRSCFLVHWTFLELQTNCLALSHSPLFSLQREASIPPSELQWCISSSPTWNNATNCWTLLWAITTGSARPSSRRQPGSGTRTSALVSRMSLSKKSPRAPAKMQCMSTG